MTTTTIDPIPIVDPIDLNDVEANAAQGVFLTADAFEMLFDGGAGNGKTTAGCIKALQTMLDIPGSSGMIARYEMPELRTTTMMEFMSIVRETLPRHKVKRFNDQQGILQLENGSSCIFRGLNIPESEYGKIKNFNLGWIFIDQLEDIKEEVYLRLLQRLRHPLGPRAIWSTANPEGHNWVWRRFIKNTRQIHKDQMLEVNIDDEVFRVGASTYVNQAHLPPDYITRLRKRYPAYLASRFIDGSWDSFEGQIWPMFDENVHVIPDHSPPPGAKRFVAIDHGISAPTCALYFYVLPTREIVVYQEYYQVHFSVSHHKQMIRMLAGEPDNVAYWRLDPQCWAKTKERDGDPWSVADDFDSEPCRIPVSQANNDWEASVVHVALFLEVDQFHKNPFTGEVGSPHVFICESCVNLIDTIPGYVFDPAAMERGEEKYKKSTIRHAIDAFRYGIMSQPEPSAEVAPEMPHGTPEYYRKMIKRAKRNGGREGWRSSYARLAVG